MASGSETSFDDLPSETAVEIFTRLPVKALIRSTSVNKSWYSLITNPKFISAHIKHTISSVNEDVVLFIPHSNVSEEPYASLYSFETGNVIDKYEIPFTTRTNTMQLVGSVNGLLCLTDVNIPYVGRDLHFWNPSVRKYLSIVTSCDHKWKEKDRFFNVVGLGVVEPGEDIRVVRIMYWDQNPGKLVGEFAPVVEVFSLREKKWREIENTRVPRVASNVIGISVGHMVYWLDRVGRTENHSCTVCLMSFDFRNEVFGLMKLTDDVRYCLGDCASFSLMKFKDSLAICVFKINGSNGIYSQPFQIWLMSHEDGTVSWTLHSEFVYEQVQWPVTITKSGRLLMSCDTDSPRMAIIRVPPCLDTSFIESLVMHERGSELLELEICKVSCPRSS
ncbi:F-box protein CPR1-like isoform X1 [Apium graveolens]|uniref:F-box protein CPR1-like isoform X1 n=1 Tax=Apium graveolens TaxID=4045 RepID=UPI003D7AA50D